MSHRCFISFKKEDEYYKRKIKEKLGAEKITGKALDRWIDSESIDYVMQVIRKEYLSNTSVTLYLIGEHSSENEGLDFDGYNKQNYMIRELQATLYDRTGNRRSGLLGIVLPEMENKIYGGNYFCNQCGENHNYVYINDSTTIREFHENYYLVKKTSGCKGVYTEDGRYCVLVRYSAFMNDPDKYIDQAFSKTEQPISHHVHWKDIVHRGK